MIFWFLVFVTRFSLSTSSANSLILRFLLSDHTLAHNSSAIFIYGDVEVLIGFESLVFGRKNVMLNGSWLVHPNGVLLWVSWPCRNPLQSLHYVLDLRQRRSRPLLNTLIMMLARDIGFLLPKRLLRIILWPVLSFSLMNGFRCPPRRR